MHARWVDPSPGGRHPPGGRGVNTYQYIYMYINIASRVCKHDCRAVVCRGGGDCPEFSEFKNIPRENWLCTHNYIKYLHVSNSCMSQSATKCHMTGTSLDPLVNSSTWFRWWIWFFESSLMWISTYSRSYQDGTWLYIVLSRLLYISHRRHIVWYAAKSNYYVNENNLCFVLNYWTLYKLCCIRQQSFNYQFEICGLTRPGISTTKLTV